MAEKISHAAIIRDIEAYFSAKSQNITYPRRPRKAMSEDLSHFYADESELEGVPQDVIESMDVNDEGQRKVRIP